MSRDEHGVENAHLTEDRGKRIELALTRQMERLHADWDEELASSQSPVEQSQIDAAFRRQERDLQTRGRRWRS